MTKLDRKFDMKSVAHFFLMLLVILVLAALWMLVIWFVRWIGKL